LLFILAEKNKVMASFEKSDWVYIVGILAIILVVTNRKKEEK